jgi:folate-binding protein YgfZ
VSLTSTVTDPVLLGYRAARAGAALLDESAHARLWLGGEDRIAFLQRLTTNEMRLLPGQGTVTILTSPTARIVAVFTVQIHPTGVLLLAGPGQGPAIFNTLRTQIFFNDRVALEGRGGALAQFALLGPKAGDVLTQAGAGATSDLPLFGWRTVTIAGVDLTVQRTEGVGSEGFVLLAPPPAAQAVRTALLRAGATPLPEDAYQILRVEAGVPAPGAELTEDVTPLEAGLRRFCDDHKGCYTGQEVIARQITYDKVATHLVGLLPASPVDAKAHVQAGDAQSSASGAGQGIGWVSSAVHSLALDRPMALAFVRRAFSSPGTQVVVQIDAGPVQAEVVSLPVVG